MFSMFARKPTPPLKVESDEIVSLPFFDDTLLMANTVMTTMYVYDTALDAKKLSGSLERLAQRPGWRKMSARIRKTVGVPRGKGGILHAFALNSVSFRRKERSSFISPRSSRRYDQPFLLHM